MRVEAGAACAAAGCKVRPRPLRPAGLSRARRHPSSCKVKKRPMLFTPLVSALREVNDSVGKFPHLSLQIVLKQLMKFVPE
jgi:hypothetical protein